MTAQAKRPALVAGVGGFPAWVFVTLLRADLPRWLKDAEAGGKADRRRLAEVRDAFAAMNDAANAYQAWLSSASANGRTEALETEIGARLPDEISPDEAAVLLGVTASRVRQELRASTLRGRRCGGRWLVERSGVELRAAS